VEPRYIELHGTAAYPLLKLGAAQQTVSDVYLKRTWSRVTSASGVLNDYALYTNTRTHSLTQLMQMDPRDALPHAHRAVHRGGRSV